MQFAYKGRTKQSEKVRGVVEAEDLVEAKIKLRSMEIRPTELKKKANWDLQKLSEVQIGAVIDLKGLLIFTRQFGSLIDAGVPVVQCFGMLASQEKRPAFRKILEQIKNDIESGGSLTEALRRHPKVFNTLYVSLVEAGEMSGTLESNLRRIGEQFEKSGRIRAKVKGALLYPCITLFVAVVVLVFLLVKVIPEISKLYSDASAELPVITQKVLAISEWVQTSYTTMIMVAVGLGLGTFIAFKIPPVKKVLDPLLLRVPLFGDLIKKATITRLARTLSTLISSGVPLMNAFDICTRLSNNSAIQKVITDTANLVAEGKTMAYGFGLQPNIFPPMVIHMVSIGEVTGKLDDLLDKVANIYEEEVDDAVSNMTGLIQPVMIVCVGGIIAFLLTAMYLPIFQLAEKATGGL